MVSINYIKPSVLSCDAKIWKLTDFEFCTQASFKELYPICFSHGTSCYLSSELLRLDSNSSFNNKVNICGLRYIIYKLFFRQKAFSINWAVVDYTGSGELLLLSTLIMPQFSSTEMIIDENLKISNRFEQLMQRIQK